MENRILKLCLDILEKGNEFVDCGAIDCNCCPFNDKNCYLAMIGSRVEGRAIAETYIKKHTQEERNSTEKTFREVIADIKEGETWVNDFAPISFIRLREDGVLDFNQNEGINLNSKYTLKRKEYTFEEAFKAYEEGKEIESCIKNLKIKKLNNKPHYIYKHMSEWEHVNNDDACFSIDEIQGKWYINN